MRFLCRRLVILASEDVGNADPHALNPGRFRDAGLRVRRVAGMPTSPLAQAVTYLACTRSRTPRRWRLAQLAVTSVRDGCCRCRFIFARTTLVPSKWGTVMNISIHMTRPRASPRRIIWGSSASTTGPSIAVWKKSSHSDCSRFAHSKGSCLSRLPALGAGLLTPPKPSTAGLPVWSC